MTRKTESMQSPPDDDSNSVHRDNDIDPVPRQRHDISLPPPPPPPVLIPSSSIATVSTVESSSEGIEEADSQSQLRIISVLSYHMVVDC